MDLQGFRFHDAPIHWTLAPADNKVASLQQVLAKFYDQFDYSDVESFKPLGWARNPEREGTPYYGLSDVIVIPFRRGFYIVIEKQYREIYGPHSATVYYKGYQTEETVWVAIVQIAAMFYSDTQLVDLLTKALMTQEFFQSEHTQQLIVNL